MLLRRWAVVYENLFGSCLSREGGALLALARTAKNAAVVAWIVSCCVFRLATTTFAAPGDLDPNFAGTGKTRLGFGSGDDQIGAVAVQTDGKIVVAGSSENGAGYGFSVARYNSDGSLDASFGNAGKVTTTVNTPGDLPNGVAIQSDGKIVVVGTVIRRE